MFQVVLADDENRILKTIQTSIPWARMGLEVAGCASNGTQALELMRQTGARIIVTDIRMPGLDGLALCRALREQNPDVQIILISGYADFSYARSAIELNALGYCLKPVNMTELQGLLKTAVKNISKEMPLKKDDLLDCIETGSEADIRKHLGDFGLDSPSLYLASSMNLHDIGPILGADLSIRLGRHKYIYFAQAPFDRQAACGQIVYAAETCGIGLYPHAVPPLQLKDAIPACVIMAFQFFITGSSCLCEHPVEGSLTDELFRKLKEVSKTKDNMQQFLQDLKSRDLSLLFNIHTAWHFYYQISSSRLTEGLDAEERFLSGYEQLAGEYGSFRAVLDEVEEKLNASASCAPEHDSRASSFMQIIKYLNENYTQDISLKKLSEEFHLNPSYVSYLIKNETGLTYSQYLTDLRIGKARRLLETTDLSLAEISEAVGFNDYFYFIKKFKKVVGVTPGHYSV